MNEIRRPISEADEIAKLRALLDRFAFPDFVVGYTIKLGQFDDEPAVWIKFETTHPFPDSKEGLLAVGKELSSLAADAHEYLRDHFPERYPYFRFGDPVEATRLA